MKVLHIITSLELGGAEKLLSELLPTQKNMGCDVELLILTDERAVFLDSLKNAGIPVHVISLKKINSPKNIFEISKFLDHHNFDIIHTHLTHAQYWTALSKFIRRDKKRVYVTSEHSTFNKRRNNRFLYWIDKFVYSQYKNIISISSATQESLLQWIGNSERKKCVVIENGIDLKKIFSAIPGNREEFRLATDIKILTMAARFNFSKDHQTVIKTLSLLPKDYKLILIGDGETKQEIEKLVKTLKLEERVIFTGVRHDVTSLFKMSNLILHISNFEGFGLGAVEAMASGTPLIASDVDGLREVISDGAILVPKGDIEKLYEVILFLFENINVMGLWKEKGINRSKKYDIQLTAEKYIALYGELLC